VANIIDNIRKHVTGVTERIYDHNRLTHERELTVDEYLDDAFETMYDKYVVETKGLRLRFVRSDFLYGRYLATVSHGNGCKVTYELHY